MVCPYCNKKTRVFNSRLKKRSNEVWRRRYCTYCGATFTTVERADLAQIWRVRGSDGNLSIFIPESLFLSIYQSLGHRKNALTDALHITRTVTDSIGRSTENGIINKSFITEAVMVCLNRFDKVASSHYRAYHH